MEMDDKDIERQNKLKGLWNDSKRYQIIREEVKNAIRQSRQGPHTIPFYRQRYFAIAATIIILIGISVMVVFIVQKPFSGSTKDDLTHGNDTTLKLNIDKPDSKARQQIYSDDIILQWANVYDTITHLVILDARDNKIVFQTEIKPAQQSFQLPENKLKPGNYEWYIGDKKLKRKLTIGN